jgi:hypothetical protein
MASKKDNAQGAAAPTTGAAANSSAEPSPGAAKGLVEIVGKFWQLIAALVGIVTAVIAGVTYFATREQLTQLDCAQTNNLIVTTSPTAIAELKLQIQLAQKELFDLKRGSLQALSKQTEIDELIDSKKKAQAAYDEAYKQTQRHACFDQSTRNQSEKKP